MENVKIDGLASEKPNKEIVELIKYIKRGEAWYKITIDGIYVDNSCTQDLKQANEMYETVLQYGSLVIETVLRSHEIQKGGQNG